MPTSTTGSQEIVSCIRGFDLLRFVSGGARFRSGVYISDDLPSVLPAKPGDTYNARDLRVPYKTEPAVFSVAQGRAVM